MPASLPEAATLTPLNEENLNTLLDMNSDLWELDRFGCKDKWALDSSVPVTIAQLAAFKRAEEELFILSDETQRFVNWEIQQLNDVEAALSALCDPSLLNDILLEKGARALEALESIGRLDTWVRLLRKTQPMNDSFKKLEG